MSLKDFLREFKKSLEYSDVENPKREEPIYKKEPVEENIPKNETATQNNDKVERQQIYGRRIETNTKPQTFDREFYSFRKPIYKDIVVLVIENSSYTRNYKEEISQLVKKITESNKECFFLLVKIGDDKRTYNILNFDLLEKEKILDNWFTDTIAQPCNYLEVISFIEEYYRSIVIGFEFWDTNEKEAKKYSIDNINVVFIGSGNTSMGNEDKKECMQLLKKLKSKMKIKSIKYFCTLDSQTVNVARLGFPVIGHIETDFYK